MDLKLSRMLTQDEGTPPTNSCDTSIKWSCDKSKTLYLWFHKAQGPQTQQGGNQNEKTPPNMSYDTSFTPSRDNYLVGNVHQLKLSPKTGRFQMILTTMQMCSFMMVVCKKEVFMVTHYFVAGCFHGKNISIDWVAQSAE